MTENDKNDILTENIDVMIDNACQIVALAKEKQTNIKTLVYVDNEGNDAVAFVYDFNLYTWKSGDTFDKIARDEMGNADLGTLIAYYNEIADETLIETGTKIKIPVLAKTENNQGNMIYAEPGCQENYGIDIKLGENGELCTRKGDLEVIEGVDNLSQALSLRLTTASRKRVRLNAYGIRSSVGDTLAVQSYLISSVEQTVKADPRIKEIEEISLFGNNDKLMINVAFVDINGNSNNYKGEI